MSYKRISEEERRALLFTLAVNRRNLEAQRTELRRMMKSAARRLESIDQQLDDIEQSERYLKDE